MRSMGFVCLRATTPINYFTLLLIMSPAQADSNADTCRCVMGGCLCCYSAWYVCCALLLSARTWSNSLTQGCYMLFLIHSDCNNPILLCKGAEDCLCVRHSFCCAINTPNKGMGLTTEKDRGECCKIGCFCCDLGLIWPNKLCGCASQCLCWYEVANFPCSNEYIPAPVCTVCPFCQCCPRCGCCVAPPPCPALDKMLRD